MLPSGGAYQGLPLPRAAAPLFENSCSVFVDPFTHLGAAIARKSRANAKAEREANDQTYKVGVHCSFELGALPVTRPQFSLVTAPADL